MYIQIIFQTYLQETRRECIFYIKKHAYAFPA